MKTKLLKPLWVTIFAVVSAWMSATSHNTLDNHTGNWQDAATWESGDGILSNNDVVTIYGFVTRSTSLSLNNNVELFVHDTLIVYGDLLISNNGLLHVETGGLVVVYGNVTADNNVIVDLNSYFVAMGDWIQNNNSSVNAPAVDTLLYVTGTTTCNFAECLDDTVVGNEELMLANPDLVSIVMETTTKILPSHPAYCEGDSVKLFVRNDGSNYQWFCDNQPIDGATNWFVYARQPGHYDVIFDAGGQSYVLGDLPMPVHVEENSSPSVFLGVVESSGAASNDGILCSGDSATLTANGGISYLWSTGATDSSIVVSSSGTYIVTARNVYGCEESRSVTVSVNPLPVATISVVETSGPLHDRILCWGDTAKLTATGGVSYLWNNGSALSDLMVHESGTYSVQVTDTNGCVMVVNEEVLVRFPVVADIGVFENSGLANDGILCAGESAICTANGGETYLWSTGSVLSSLSVNSSDSIVLTAYDGYGCFDTDTVALIISPLPSGSVGVSEVSGLMDGDGVLCEGDSATLIAPSGYTYLWSTGDLSQNTLVYTAGSYSVMLTDSLGCKNTLSMDIVMNHRPQAIIATSGDQLTCLQTEVSLNGNSSVFDDIPQFAWSTLNGHMVSGAETSTVVVDQPGDYQLVITDLGCMDTSFVTISQGADVPLAVIVRSADRISCDSLSIVLDGSQSMTGSGNALDYLWSTGEVSDSIVIDSSGVYWLKVTDSMAGCSNTTQVVIDEDIIHPVVSLIASSEKITCSDTLVYLNVSGSYSLNSSHVLSYHWNDGDTLSTKVIDQAGDYSIEVKDQTNGCVSSQTISIAEDKSPPPSVIIVGDTLIDCKGKGHVYNVPSNAGSSYRWNVPAGATIVNGDSTHRVSIDFNMQGGEVTVVETAANGCAGELAKTTVEMQPCHAIPEFLVDKKLICLGERVMFENQSLYTDSTTTYFWNFGEGAEPATSNDLQPDSVYYQSPGTKKVSLFVWRNGMTEKKTLEAAVEVQEIPDVFVSDQSICGAGMAIVPVTGNRASRVEFSLDGGMSIFQSDEVIPFEGLVSLGNGSSVLLFARSISEYGCVSPWSPPVSITSKEKPGLPVLKKDSQVIDPSIGDPNCLHDGVNYNVDPHDGALYRWLVQEMDIAQIGNHSYRVNWNSPGSYHLGVQEISANGCASDTFMVPVQVYHPTVSLGEDVDICEGGSYLFSIHEIFQSYLWHDQSSHSSYQADQSEKVWVTVTDANGCTASDTAVVEVHLNPVVDLGPDTMLGRNDVLLLEPGFFESYEWSDGQTTPSIEVHPGVQTIELTVFDSYGCSGHDGITIEECIIAPLKEVTNVFTPNGDLIHDTWVINGIEDYPEAEIQVFDSGGKRVFYCAKGYQNDWDGTHNGRRLPVNNYFYVIDLKGDGSKILKGNLTIIK